MVVNLAKSFLRDNVLCRIINKIQLKTKYTSVHTSLDFHLYVKLATKKAGYHNKLLYYLLVIELTFKVTCYNGWQPTRASFGSHRHQQYGIADFDDFFDHLRRCRYCQSCRCEISKTLCGCNLAVEKRLSELPTSCAYCNILYASNELDAHQRDECAEQPMECAYKRIDCTRQDLYHELDAHIGQCVSESTGLRHARLFNWARRQKLRAHQCSQSICRPTLIREDLLQRYG